MTATTNPAGLTTVSFTYAGNSTAPTSAGSYAVVATLTNANYKADNATGTLVIGPATPAFTNLSAPAITYKDASASISGVIKAGNLVPPGSIGISVAGPGGALTGSAQIDATTGGFSTTINTSTLPAKPTGYAVALDFPASANFKGVSDNSLTLVVNKASQSINFGALTDKTFGDPSFEVSATSTSGLPVSFSIVSGPAAISANTVVILGTGTVTVRATQRLRRCSLIRAMGSSF